MTVRSPPVRCCPCAGRRAGASFSPLTRVVPACVTPELEYLQVKCPAHLPYATATALLTELLPIHDSISVTSVKRRVRVVGKALPGPARRVPRRSPRLFEASTNRLAGWCVGSDCGSIDDHAATPRGVALGTRRSVPVRIRALPAPGLKRSTVPSSADHARPLAQCPAAPVRRLAHRARTAGLAAPWA